MAVIPLWYRLVLEFNDVFHSIIDVLFIVVGFLTVGVVSHLGWRQHLRWASPLAAGAVLTGCYRLILDLHHYLHVGGMSVYLASDVLLYFADGVSLYGTWMLWLTLRNLAQHPASLDPLAQSSPPPGVWPPAPTARP